MDLDGNRVVIGGLAVRVGIVNSLLSSAVADVNRLNSTWTGFAAVAVRPTNLLVYYWNVFSTHSYSSSWYQGNSGTNVRTMPLLGPHRSV